MLLCAHCLGNLKGHLTPPPPSHSIALMLVGHIGPLYYLLYLSLISALSLQLCRCTCTEHPSRLLSYFTPTGCCALDDLLSSQASMQLCVDFLGYYPTSRHNYSCSDIPVVIFTEVNFPQKMFFPGGGWLSNCYPSPLLSSPLLWTVTTLGPFLYLLLWKGIYLKVNNSKGYY